MIPSWLETWFKFGDTGLSSRTMAYWLSGELCLRQISTPAAPSDTSDVGRCVYLLDLAEEHGEYWREDWKLADLISANREWAALIPRWSEIEAAYRADVAAQDTWHRACYRSDKGRTLKRRRTDLPMPRSVCWTLVSTLRGHGNPYTRVTPSVEIVREIQ